MTTGSGAASSSNNNPDTNMGGSNNPVPETPDPFRTPKAKQNAEEAASLWEQGKQKRPVETPTQRYEEAKQQRHAVEEARNRDRLEGEQIIDTAKEWKYEL